MNTLDEQIAQWRAAVTRGPAVDAADADELESHLREQIADLETAGMSPDEAFFIAVRRLGAVNKLTAEYAREHSDRLWKQLAISHVDEGQPRPLLVMLGLAVLAGALVQLARGLAAFPATQAWFDPEATSALGVPIVAASLAVFAVLTAYFAIQRKLPLRWVVALAAIIVGLGVIVNLFPLGEVTGVLVAIHLPVLLWLVVGVAYTGGEVRSSARRMDFIRFSGEWAIYYALIALGGAVLMALTIAILSPIAPGAVDETVLWVVPSGAAGAVIVAAWLVEAKKSVIENLAPVLTAIFTPLFALMLLVAAVTYTIAGIGRDFDRNLLTVFDVLLIVVVGLVVYAISARGADRRPGAMAVIQLVAVLAAILLDVVVLISMLSRVGEFGFTANRVAALGLNVVLLVNLAVTAWLCIRQVAGRESVARLERWQTGYVTVFAVWVALVVLVLPPMFGFA
ncbi:MAG: permease prefix domain 1-containing protein [Pseudolysinimonas sp.]